MEGVLDSSRYFVLKIVDVSEKHAFIGVGFGDRGDAFDMNVSLQDHFKYVSSALIYSVLLPGVFHSLLLVDGSRQLIS